MANRFFENAKSNGISSKYSKYFLITVSTLAVLSLVVLGGLYWYEYQRPLAVIGGEKVTKKMARENGELYRKFFERTDSNDSLANTEKAGARLLIEEKAILYEATKRGIIVPESDIEDQFKRDYSNYPNKEEYLKLASSEYGWSEAQVKNRIKVDLLRSELEKSVLNSKNVRGYYFRHDIYGSDNVSIERAKNELTNVRKEIIAGATFEAIDQRYYNNSVWKLPASGNLEFEDVNSTTEAELFGGRQDWQGIDSLSKTGDVTPVLKSDGGYFAIYQLVSLNQGGYNTWNDFIDSYYNKQTPLLTSVVRLTFPRSAFALCENSALRYDSKNNCCNMTDYTATKHYAVLQGTVRDNITKSAIDGVRIGITRSANYSDLCTGAITAMGGDSYVAWSSSTGYYKKPAINCWLQYLITASKDGYQTRDYADFKPANGTTSTQNIYLFPAYSLNVTAVPAEAATGTDTWVSYASYKGDCLKAGSGCYAVRTAGFDQTTAQASLYTFKSWTGDCSGTDSTYDVTMKGAMSCQANFEKVIVGSPTCVLTPNSKSIASGNAPTLTWTTSGTPTKTDIGGTAVSPVTGGSKVMTAITASTTYKMTVTNAGGSNTCSTTVNILPSPTLNCVVSPSTGTSPLVVRVVATIVNAVAGTNYTFDYSMGDGISLTGKQDTIFHTYNTEGTKSIQITSSQMPNAKCDASVVVVDPSVGSGGEVRP